ncbi:serine protease [Aureimonas fodinaquatilis]|nr:serine protease [Aureimonas fodinaquatilis]
MRQALNAVLTGFLVFVLPATTLAEPANVTAASSYFKNTDTRFRAGMQMRLAWTGDYTGKFDGIIGNGSLDAIQAFQDRHGLAADGRIDEAFLDALITESDEAMRLVGFGWEDDTRTGVRLGLPFELVQEIGATEVGSMWRSTDSGLEIETVRFVKEGYTLDEVFRILNTPVDGKQIDDAAMGTDGFTIDGHEEGRRFHIRFDGRDMDLRGFSVSYSPQWADEIAPYMAVANGSFQPYASEPVAEPDQGPIAELSRQPRYALAFSDIMNDGLPDATRSSLEVPPAALGSAPSGLGGYETNGAVNSSGTGFVVSEDGWILTNAHVAKSCSSIAVGDLGLANKVVVDEEQDLALLHVRGEVGPPLPIHTGKPRLGEDILALGFPLRSILADSLNVTRGNISSLLGLMNDPNYLQISAAVQPGNSGGPVIDLAGRVVGVVTAKLNAVAVADLTGDIPQTINFAIRPDVATSFLREHDVEFVDADPDAELQSVPDATAMAQASILPVVCLGLEASH